MTIYQIRITLRDTKPPIWRRLAVPSDITLGQLHEVVQIAMGWTYSHLHQFVLKDKTLKKDSKTVARLADQGRWEEMLIASSGVRSFVPATTPFGDPTEMDGEDEDAVTLGEVCTKVKSKLIYEYDFGDGWEHTIDVQKITEPEAGAIYPTCLAGKLACPPEDCGGVWGYYRMLEVIADPDHVEHEDMVEWLGEHFDAEAFDIEEVNAALARWRDGQGGPQLRLTGSDG